MKFIEFVIATTIGSIVGAYIARDITLDFPLIVRAVFAVAILAVFFFLVYKVSSSWAKRKNERNKPQEQRESEAFDEEYPSEGRDYAEEDPDETSEENQAESGEEYGNKPEEDYPEKQQPKRRFPRRH